MAVFETQISTEVTHVMKREIKDVLVKDRELYAGTHEADVVRAAVELGLAELNKIEVRGRREIYARQRSGLKINAPE